MKNYIKIGLIILGVILLMWFIYWMVSNMSMRKLQVEDVEATCVVKEYVPKHVYTRPVMIGKTTTIQTVTDPEEFNITFKWNGFTEHYDSESKYHRYNIGDTVVMEHYIYTHPYNHWFDSEGIRWK